MFLSHIFLITYEKPVVKYKYGGLRFVGNNSHPQAVDKARSYDLYGNWICVNVKSMSYKRGLEICAHEMAHEIFAVECSKNMSKCLEVME